MDEKKSIISLLIWESNLPPDLNYKLCVNLECWLTKTDVLIFICVKGETHLGGGLDTNGSTESFELVTEENGDGKGKTEGWWFILFQMYLQVCVQGFFFCRLFWVLGRVKGVGQMGLKCDKWCRLNSKAGLSFRCLMLFLPCQSLSLSSFIWRWVGPSWTVLWHAPLQLRAQPQGLSKDCLTQTLQQREVKVKISLLSCKMLKRVVLLDFSFVSLSAFRSCFTRAESYHSKCWALFIRSR